MHTFPVAIISEISLLFRHYCRCLTALRISGWRTRELARGDGCPLQPLDGLARSARQKADGNSLCWAAFSQLILQYYFKSVFFRII
jgi:hypothetical protein